MLRAVAFCHTCGWRLDARNAVGTGARHAQAHGHKVCVEVETLIYFGPWGKANETQDSPGLDKGKETV